MTDEQQSTATRQTLPCGCVKLYDRDEGIDGARVAACELHKPFEVDEDSLYEWVDEEEGDELSSDAEDVSAEK